MKWVRFLACLLLVSVLNQSSFAALTVVQQWAPTSQGVWPAAKGTVWAKTAVTSIVGVSTAATAPPLGDVPAGDVPAGK